MSFIDSHLPPKDGFKIVNVSRKKINRYLCAGIALVITALGTRFSSAQDLILVNPADRGDGRASIVNPAIAAYQDRLFAVGTRVLYYGLVGGFDFNHSYFNLTASHRSLAGFDELGYGIQGQMLQTPMFNALALNALLAKQWGERLAVGVNVGFSHRGFDRSTFKLEVENDLALAKLSKWVFPDLGVGMVAVPSRYVTVAMSFNHLNRPNTALSDSVAAPLPRAFNSGIAIGYGNFRALFSVAYNERDIVPRFAIEGFRERLGYMRFGFSREAALMDARINVMEGVALNFRYNYPLNELSLASSGSPELGFEFNFDKNPSLYAMEWTEPEVPRRPSISLAHAFLVESAYDTLFITEKYIKRTLDSSLVKQLQQLPKAIFFAADQDSILPLEPEKIFLSEEELQNRPKIGAVALLKRIEEAERTSGRLYVPRDSAGIFDEMKRNHTPGYMTAFREFAERLKSTSNVQSNFVTPPDAKRAHLLLRYLSLFTKLNDNIKVTVEDSVTADFHRQEPEMIGTNEIPTTDFRLALRAYDKTKLGGRGLLVNSPVDTFRFSLNLIETERWGPVKGEFFLKNDEGQIILRDSTIVGKSSMHNQILRQKLWDWKLKDGSYPPEGNYYYYLVWHSADEKLYRSPENRLRVERNRIASEIKLSRTMPEANPKSRLRTLVRMN